MSTHEELMEWLASDRSNVHRFVKAIDKLILGHVVLIEGDDGSLVTGFMASRRNRRIRR